MKKEKTDLNAELKDLEEKSRSVLSVLLRYKIIIFILMVGCVYGYMLLRINTLNTAQPSPDAITRQVKAAHIPRIDPAAVQQLESLQDHSVNVQALFNQARNNPFQ